MKHESCDDLYSNQKRQPVCAAEEVEESPESAGFIFHRPQKSAAKFMAVHPKVTNINYEMVDQQENILTLNHDTKVSKNSKIFNLLLTVKPHNCIIICT